MDANWNSAYPYVVGPTFYGNVSGAKVQTISESVTTYTPVTAIIEQSNGQIKTSIYPNPSSDFIAVQIDGLLTEKLSVQLFDINGRLVQQMSIQPGSTIGYFHTETLYDGVYLVSYQMNGKVVGAEKVVVDKY